MHLERFVIVIGLFALALFAVPAFTQSPPPNLPPVGGYQPIPNFTGPEAGRDFRGAVNDRFSGDEAIAPKIVSVPFASLPAEQDGLEIYCTDCQRTTPCAASGTGAWAFGANGQFQCNTGAPTLKLDGTDILGPYNGIRTNEKNILDFGAIASTARINCSTNAGQANITCSGIATSDFAVNQYVALYGAGAAPSVAQPTGFTVQPTTTTNSPTDATHNTRFVQGCTVQNAVAWCTGGSALCAVSNVSFYEAGQSISIAGAGPGGAALATTISVLDDGADQITLATPASTTVNGGAITGANCTATRRYQAYPIDANGGWGQPTAVITATNTGSALNWGNWVDVQVNVPQPPNAPNPTYPLPSNIPIAWAFYCAEGTNPLQLCGVEVPTYSFTYNNGFPAPWNDALIGGTFKGFPTVVTFHDLGRPYGHDMIQGVTPPSGPVNQIAFAKILSISGTTVHLSGAPAQTGTFSMGHDNGPVINQAIKASCDTNFRCGSVFTPYEPNVFPVASPIIALRGQGLHLFGGAGPTITEPGAIGPAGWLWVGALGGTMLQLNQEAKPQVDNLTLLSSVPSGSGTTMGVAIDMDEYDPGDGLGQVITGTRLALRDMYTGQASVGVRFANLNLGNIEFGVVESSIINFVYGQSLVSGSNIGFLLNSSNTLATRFDGSTITGNIGIWSNIAGFYAVESEMGQVDGVSVWLGAGYGHPVTIESCRLESRGRFVYSPFIGGSTGTQLTLRDNTLADIRVPIDGDFLALAGGQTTILEGNEFTLSGLGLNGDYTTIPFPSGIILAGQTGPVEAHGNYWSNICSDPYSFIGPVNTSGDMCTGPDGSAKMIGPISRGGGGFRIGSPVGGPKGEGSLNLEQSLYFKGAQAIDSSTNFTGAALNISATPGAVTGTTSGQASYIEPAQGANWKFFQVNFNNYENTTGTAQIITFPTAFSGSPTIIFDPSCAGGTPGCANGATLSGMTGINLPKNMTAAINGNLIVVGF